MLTTPTPNPFNPRTTFAFVLNERQEVELAIYDLAGRQTLRRAFVLIDMRHGVKPVDEEILGLLLEVGFLSPEHRGNLLLEMTPWPGKTVEETIADSFATFGWTSCSKSLYARRISSVWLPALKAISSSSVRDSSTSVRMS